MTTSQDVWFPDEEEVFPYTPKQKAWLEDLETTLEPQIKSRLRDKRGNCCLGRALMVLGEQPSSIESMGGLCGWGDDNEQSNLLFRDQKALNLRGGDAPPRDFAEADSLTQMNDGGKSFKEIAQAIRANPEVWFNNLDVREVG